MSTHQHLSSEEALERVSSAAPAHDALGCPRCQAEMASLSHFVADLKRSDAELTATTEWDDLLLRRRIREAVMQERPHPRSIFNRFAILRPALASALAAGLAFAVWVPLSRTGPGSTQVASADSGRLPAWAPLPDESEDEGLAVLLEWSPNEDEMEVLHCRSACLSGLSHHEEENLLRFDSVPNSRSPIAGTGTPQPPPTSGGSPL